MWLIHHLPDNLLLIAVNFLLAIGILSFFICFFLMNRLIRWFPKLSSYYLVLQIVSSLLLAAGIYYKGGYAIEMEWRAEVERLKQEIEVAEAKAKEKNEEIKIVYKNKIKVVKKVVAQVKREIEEKKVSINEGCTMSPTAVEIYNKAVKGSGSEDIDGDEK